MTDNAREFDVLVWGASGFTGRLVAEYLLATYGVTGGVRWALAGRSQSRLESVREALGPQAAALPIRVAAIDDPAGLAALAASTRVVCTTVGPYALYGSSLVAACVAAGTHCCDLTGEVHWMRRMIDQHHEAARASGARIVHTCGFDSIPSDIGTWHLQETLRARHGAPAPIVQLRAREFRGGFSGGTIASMLNMLSEAEQDAAVMAVMSDPYGLNPSGSARGLDGPEHSLPWYDAGIGAWVTPFIMAAINTKVVRRTNALLGYPYGHDFRYQEGTVMPWGSFGLPLAFASATASAAAMAAIGVPALRRFIGKRLPQPGEGPSQALRESGYYVLDLYGRYPQAPRQDLCLRIRGDRDPGYGSTAKMLAESAVCLAQDDLDSPGGVLTPAAAMGSALVSRLSARAGLTFEFQ